METKKAIESKTFWFNMIGALLTSLEAFTGAAQSQIPVNAYLVMLTISVSGNFALRFYTDKAVAIK